MTQQNNDFSEEHNRLIQEAKEQIERQKYQEAIDNLNYIINNSDRDGQAFFLRGQAYLKLEEYQPALDDFETALEIYQETDDKNYQIYTFLELAFLFLENMPSIPLREKFSLIGIIIRYVTTNKELSNLFIIACLLFAIIWTFSFLFFDRL